MRQTERIVTLTLLEHALAIADAYKQGQKSKKPRLTERALLNALKRALEKDGWTNKKNDILQAVEESLYGKGCPKPMYDTAVKVPR